MLDCRRIANSTTCLGIDGAVPALRGRYGDDAKYPITVRHELDETKIVPLATELHEAHDVVVIDTAGAASQATIFAIGCADLVLYPSRRRARISSRPSRVNLIKSASQMMRKEIPTRVVLTAVQPGTNIAEHIEKEVTKASLPVLAKQAIASARRVSGNELHGDSADHGPRRRPVLEFSLSRDSTRRARCQGRAGKTVETPLPI